MWKKILGPSTNLYDKIHHTKGGRQCKGYSLSGSGSGSGSRNSLIKELESWASKAESVAEYKSRNTILDLFCFILINPYYFNKEKSPEDAYEVLCKDGCMAINIKLQGRSLTSFPVHLPKTIYEIELLDLSDNLLKEIPRGGYYKRINMSGNPLNKCLDSIREDVHFLDLRDCSIKELTPSLFNDFESMAYKLKSFDTHREFVSGVLYEINLSGNPLSEQSISLIKNYARKGHTHPEIIYDDGERLDLKSSDLAKEVINEIKFEHLAESYARYVPAVNLIMADYGKAIEARKEKIKEIEEKFRLSTEYFDVEITSNISNIIKNKIADFLNELKPLSDQDWKFKEYVKNVFDELFNDEIATEFLFKNLDSFDSITFNAINLSMLMSKVAKGKFDDRPKLLVESLRDHFLSTKIKEEHSKSELDFVRWESVLQSELNMNIKKKCHISFVPPRAELINMKNHLLSEEMKGSKEFIAKNAIWEEFLRRTLPEG